MYDCMRVVMHAVGLMDVFNFFVIWITDNGRRTVVHGRTRAEIRESDGGERAEGGNVIKGQTTIHILQRKKHFQTIINGNVNVQGEFVNSYLQK